MRTTLSAVFPALLCSMLAAACSSSDAGAPSPGGPAPEGPAPSTCAPVTGAGVTPTGDVNGDEVWTAANSPHMLTGDVER